ncbi:MAG: TrmH family RNA methyltransferase [Pseudomonadota bacterium]
MRLAFFQPDIPQNVGSGMRLSACFGCGMDIIEPCAFPLTDKGVRRAAMDYGGGTDIIRWPSFEDWAAAPGRIILMTTRAAQPLWTHRFAPDDRILMGSESAGVPDPVHARADARILIPLAPGARSLNVVTAAAIALGEAARQTL